MGQGVELRRCERVGLLGFLSLSSTWGGESRGICAPRPATECSQLQSITAVDYISKVNLLSYLTSPTAEQMVKINFQFRA